jgi:hypothetical protein
VARRRVLRLGAGALLAASLPLPARAAGMALPLPEGPPLLRVGGAVSCPNLAGEAVFDDGMLGALPQHGFRTGTLWTGAPQLFEGPPLSVVLDHAGARSAAVTARAANDYAIGFEPGDIMADAPIVARRIDGRPMSLRRRGPLWIVYPFDSDPRWRSERFFSRAVWQLTHLTVAEPSG